MIVVHLMYGGEVVADYRWPTVPRAGDGLIHRGIHFNVRRVVWEHVDCDLIAKVYLNEAEG